MREGAWHVGQTCGQVLKVRTGPAEVKLFFHGSGVAL